MTKYLEDEKQPKKALVETKGHNRTDIAPHSLRAPAATVAASLKHTVPTTSQTSLRQVSLSINQESGKHNRHMVYFTEPNTCTILKLNLLTKIYSGSEKKEYTNPNIHIQNELHSIKACNSSYIAI